MDILLLLKAKLTKAGYAVSTSLNGEHLLDTVHTSHPDLILMDISMKGLDGGSLCHLLKTSDCTHDIPIVLFSGNENIQRIASDCNADAILRKPYDPASFEKVLHQFIPTA
jgi:CheY-like chemotaxis protein